MTAVSNPVRRKILTFRQFIEREYPKRVAAKARQNGQSPDRSATESDGEQSKTS